MKMTSGTSKIHPSILNIDGERVGYKNGEVINDLVRVYVSFYSSTCGYSGNFKQNEQGRHPSQLYISEEIAEIIDEQTGNRSGGKYTSRSNESNTYLKDYRSEDDKVGKEYPAGGGSKLLHKIKNDNE